MSLMFGTPEVIRMTGVPMKTLTVWCHKGHIPGQGRVGTGVPRQWTDEDVARVVEIRDAMRLAIQALEDAGLNDLARRVAGEYVGQKRTQSAWLRRDRGVPA